MGNIQELVHGKKGSSGGGIRKPYGKAPVGIRNLQNKKRDIRSASPAVESRRRSTTGLGRNEGTSKKGKKKESCLQERSTFRGQGKKVNTVTERSGRRGGGR